MDLFYVQAPATPTWLIGYDWQGKPRATIHLAELDSAADTAPVITVAPDGGGFTDGLYTFDRLGHIIYQQAAPATKGSIGATVWSEDAALLCGVEEQTSQIDSSGNGTADFYLVERTPTGPAIRVTRFLHLDQIPGDMGYQVFACSHQLDRALLVRTVRCGVQGAIVIRISDGTTLGTWERHEGPPTFSPLGDLVAEPTTSSTGATLSTVVSTVLGGTVLARYGAGITFKAFSADDRLAIVTTDDSNGPVAQVIQLMTRRVLWQDTSSRNISGVWSRPGSGDVAIGFTASPAKVPCPNFSTQPCATPLATVAVVHTDGSSVALDGAFLLPISGWVIPT